MLLLHAALLGWLPRGTGTGAPPARETVLALQLRPVPPPNTLVADTAASPAAAPAPPAPAARATVPKRAQRAASAVQAVAPVAAPADAMPRGGTPPPVYATQAPPAATLQYTVHHTRRGAEPDPANSSGLQAELRWRPEAGGYTLTLGLAASGWASVGGFDAQGLAPERHVETRRGRELRAANFRREAGPGGGRITYSGPQVEHTLLPGAQDRLSWLLQLPAVLEADPAWGEPGRQLQLFVAGVRGDAAWWTFSVLDRDPVELPAGTVAAAVHLQRLPERPYDLQVDVWLDPARHHLPVRLRLQNGAEAEGMDLRLLQLSLP